MNTRATYIGFIVLTLFAFLLVYAGVTGRGADITASIVAPILLVEEG